MKTFGDFVKMTDSSHSLWLESSQSVKNVTWVESSQHRFLMWLESLQFVTRLESRYYWYPHVINWC